MPPADFGDFAQIGSFRRISRSKPVNIRDAPSRGVVDTIAEQHEWLSAVLRGHFAYYGLPSNMRAMLGFAYEVRRLWLRALARRSQRGMTSDRLNRLLRAFPLPTPTVTRPMIAKEAVATGQTSGGAGCGKAACPDL